MKRKNKIDIEGKKKTKAKYAAILAMAMFSFLLIWFLFFKSDKGVAEIAANNYYGYEKGEVEFQGLINGVESPYSFIYHFNKFKESKDLSHLKMISNKSYPFYSSMAKVIIIDELIKLEKYEESKEIILTLKEKNFLPLKYYYQGVIFEESGEINKAIDYYELVLKLNDTNPFLKELSNLRISFIK
jgi:tetratricopeptide (TPR) repeat protein